MVNNEQKTKIQLEIYDELMVAGTIGLCKVTLWMEDSTYYFTNDHVGYCT